MVLSDEIAKLASGQFWLGGGHVDLKLRLNVDESVKIFGFTVADVTSWRPDFEESLLEIVGPPRPAARGQRCESVGFKMEFFGSFVAEKQVVRSSQRESSLRMFNTGSMFCLIPQQYSNSSPNIWSFYGFQVQEELQAGESRGVTVTA